MNEIAVLSEILSNQGCVGVIVFISVLVALKVYVDYTYPE